MTELNQFIIKDIIKDTDEQPDAEVCRRKSGRVLSVAASLPCGYRAQHLLIKCPVHQPRSSNLVIQELAKDSWFQHVGYETDVQKIHSNEWLEAVSDEVYNQLP